MNERGKPGRPTLLTPEVQEKVCDALRGGNFRSVAARAAGISVRTMMEWLTEGEANPQSPHGNFRAAVMEAEGDAERKMVEVIMRAAENDPKHGEWWLSHRHAARWAEKKKLAVSGHLEDRPAEKLPKERLIQLLETFDTSDD